MTEISWRPTCSIETLKKRAELMARIREFFSKRGYLEVETPYMGRFGVTDIHLSNIRASFRKQDYFLQTSPEYHMKRLLAAGSGPIFQIARVFRDDEFGRWHNPEFSLLEWYQLGVDHWYIIDEIQQLFLGLCDCSSFKKLSYQQAFMEACGINPFECGVKELHEVTCGYELGDVLSRDESKDQFLHLLMAFVVEPYLANHYVEPVVVHDFPASQASLAKVEGQVAKRFEIYWQGVELANGFYELTDEHAQRKRFEEDLVLRQSLGLCEMSMDEQLLASMQHGLPACSGVALGLDRLFAIILQKSSIEQVISFAFPMV